MKMKIEETVCHDDAKHCSFLRGLTLGLLALAAMSAGAAPTFSDANWANLFGLPGANGTVSASVTNANGDVYAGGNFTVIGTCFANGIAKWNGTNWSPLGFGLRGGGVSALVCDNFGNLYAGGGFTNAGGISANYIAMWNGTNWSALGSGISGGGDDGNGPYINTLACDSFGNLCAGGDFTSAGGVTGNSIAKWNGSTWSSLSSGMNGPVNSLVFDSTGNLYTAGQFTTAGGLTANNIAKWNGSAWTVLGTGISGSDFPYVVSLVFNSSEGLYAGGFFTNAGGLAASNIAKWNGSDWSALSSGINGEVDALAFGSSGNLYAGGAFTTAGGASANSIAEWNGSNFSSLGSGIGGQTFSLVFDRLGNFFAGGSFTSAGEVAANSIAEWNGGAWSTPGVSGMDYPVLALASDNSGNVYTGGEFDTAGGAIVNAIAKWNATAWSALGGGMDGAVSALLCDSSGNVYTGGSFDTAFNTAGGVSVNCIAEWNGTNWFALASGVSGVGDGYGPYVNALAFDRNGNLYAGGDFTAAGSVTANYIAKWNGSVWTSLGPGISGIVDALVGDSSGNVYAGGDFTTAGGVTANDIAKWNGRAWSALASGMNGQVNSLVFDSSSNLYAGGNFTTAGGATVNYIAKWNGSAWSALGSGMNGVVYSLAFDSSWNLYAGGAFTSAGGLAVNYISKWNGTNWFALASGVSGIGDGYGPSVNALAFDSSSNLYAGGDFTTAGTNYSAYVAEMLLPDLEAETNRPPVLSYVSNQNVDELTTLIVTNTAAPGTPATPITYGFQSAPSGASIDANGIITWTPMETQIPSTNVITTVATETGPPNLAATNSFVVAVVMMPFIYTNNNGEATITGYNGSAGRAVTIPSTINGLPITSIGAYAFWTSDLTSVTICNGVSIGEFAFWDCRLTNLTIGNGVTIGSNAFLGCPSLTNVTIGNDVSIEDYAFQNCGNLTNVTLGNGVSIGDYAFWVCSSLTSVYFQGNAPSADSEAFPGDDSVTVYYLPGTTGWSSPFDGVPAVLWNPLIQTSGASFGVQHNQFGFDITGTNSFTVVVEACTNLASPAWVPLQTLTLTNGSVYFSEPFQTETPCRFYGLGLP